MDTDPLIAALKKQERALVGLARERDRQADAALRSIDRLMENLQQARNEIQCGRSGTPMRAGRCIPSHQYMQEVVEDAAMFVAFWQAEGLTRP